MCCMTPPMTHRRPSATQSTSTSIASLRNSSTRIVGVPASFRSGVNTRLFDVLHDPADDTSTSVRDAVDIDFDRIFEKFVDENRGCPCLLPIWSEHPPLRCAA